MPDQSRTALEALLRGVRVMPVLTIARAQDAAPLADALAAGGLTALEVTLRTPAAREAIAAMKAARPDLAIGAGTVVTPADIAAAVAAGADFLVSPGAPAALAAALAQAPVPSLPGAATATEAMALSAAGFQALKFFPAEAVGGRAVLQALAGPLPQLAFCPTGGVSPENAPAYLALPNVICVGGSWIAPEALLAAGAWDEITARAAAAAKL